VLPNDSATSKVLAVSFRRAIHDNSISDIVWKGYRVIGLSLLLFKVAEFVMLTRLKEMYKVSRDLNKVFKGFLAF
jgi:hypothetical protein